MSQQPINDAVESQEALLGTLKSSQMPFLMTFAEKFPDFVTIPNMSSRSSTYLGVTGTGNNMKNDYADDK